MTHLARRRVGFRQAGGQSGFTLFELIVVVCVLATMIVLLLNRLQVYKEAAEKVAMQQTAAAIKSALQMRAAAYMIGGREAEIENLVAQNPVSWLQESPGNYAGEFFADAYARVAPGNWYYDLTRQELVYVINLGDNFKPGPDGRKWVRYRVRVGYEDLPQPGEAPRKVLSAISFAPAQPYVWF